jgi:hypothetical protein
MKTGAGINMKNQNPLEQLLYPSTIEQTIKPELNHPYEKGIFISINNNKTDAATLIQQYPRQYQTLIHSICGRSISRENIRHSKKLPSRELIADLVAEKKLLVVSGIHDYKRKDGRGGSKRNYDYQHTHFYVYGAHHYLPAKGAELEAAEKKICRNLQRYTNTTNKRYCLIKVASVGNGIYRHSDSVTPTTLYDYLLTASPQASKRTLLSYIASNRHNPSIPYPISYLYEV